MQSWRKGWAGAALGVTLVLAGPSAGWAAPPGAAAQTGPLDVPDAATLSGDHTIVETVMRDAGSQGYGVIAAHQAELEAILAHAPAAFHETEDHGARIYVRGVDGAACLEGILAQVSQREAAHLPARDVICVDNPYPLAALLLGSYYNEIGQSTRAQTMLDRGLVWAPGNPALTAEKGAAQIARRLWAQALQTFSDGLANGAKTLKPEETGRLLRGRGFALTELGRFDEAEQAYRRSLEVDPNHGHATEELAYIARVKAGGRPTAAVLIGGLPPSPPPK
jgi:tetratricopeptide (TPR) repeat protein